MPISKRDIKLLWGRAASRCAFPDCRIKLTQDKRTASDSFPFGEQAHIVGEKEDAPRGESSLSPDERDSYFNLILLCPTHHRIIDSNPEDYPVEKLHLMKVQHEVWVEQTLSDVEAPRLRDELEQAVIQKVMAEFSMTKSELNKESDPERGRRITKNVERSYAPFSVFSKSMRIWIDTYLMKLLKLRIDLEVEIRASVGLLLNTTRLNAMREQLCELVRSNVEFIIDCGWHDAEGHLIFHKHDFEYKFRELDEYRKQLLSSASHDIVPFGLDEWIDTALIKAEADLVIRAAQASSQI